MGTIWFDNDTCEKGATCPSLLFNSICNTFAAPADIFEYTGEF